MRKVIVISICALIVLYVDRACGCQWVTEYSGTNLKINSIFFADTLHGWAVGGDLYSGHYIILRTTTGGDKWSVADSGGAENGLNSVWFIDTTTGWAVGPKLIMKTADGGSSWAPQPSGTTGWLSGVCFTDANNGWACLDYDKSKVGEYIIHTTDGGLSWETQSLPSDNLTAFDIHFTDSLHGICSGGRDFLPGYDNSDWAIWRTADGGATWAQVYDEIPGPAACGMLTHVWMVDSRIGWAAGGAFGPDVYYPGRVVHTTDGGLTWEHQSLPQAIPFVSVFFVDSLWGWVGGTGGKIFHTTDGGTTWHTDTTSTDANIWDIHGCNRFHACAVTEQWGTILKYKAPTYVQENETPLDGFALKNTPNPLTYGTTIVYCLPFTTFISLKIYDVSGSLVCTLKEGNELSGAHTLYWNVDSGRGKVMPQGIYFLRLEAKNCVKTVLLILVRSAI